MSAASGMILGTQFSIEREHAMEADQMLTADGGQARRGTA
jgi:hypothetical protein